jgi:Leucine-rich repeat (LRR) protein
MQRFRIVFPLFLLLTACADYVVTLNNMTISEPKLLYQPLGILDENLRSCISESIRSNLVTGAGDLQMLSCNYAGITNLAGIQQFTQLSHIKLDHNNLVGIEPLLFLENLRLVDITGNSEVACREIAELKKLIGKDLLISDSCSRQ